MSKNVLQPGLRLLAIAAIAVTATITAPDAQAIDTSYTQTATAGTMEEACCKAVQKIHDNCDKHGTITTDPRSCKPIWNIDGELAGYACTCDATTTYCARLVGFPG